MEPTQNETKEWWKSRTLWLSVMAVALGLFQWLQGQIETGASITLMGALMALMRLITKSQLE